MFYVAKNLAIWWPACNRQIEISQYFLLAYKLTCTCIVIPNKTILTSNMALRVPVLINQDHV